jgi:plastocyanin
MHGRAGATATALVVALAVPATANAATKTVSAGPFAKGKQFQKAFGDGNEYYRRTITIHRGDRVKWTLNGFHSVTFVPKGDPPPGLLVPDPANLVSGVTDAAGAPFWFNGQPNLAFNPLASAPQGGKQLDPDALTSSGLPLAQGPPPPYTLKFPKTGTFSYLCTVHPGMAGRVKVVAPGRAIPSKRQDKRAAKRELASTLKTVTKLSAGQGTSGLQNTIQAGNDRRSGPTVFKYFPTAPSVKVGDTVTLQMPPSTSEVHTFTFGPSNGKDQYVDQLAAGLLGEVFDPRGVYPSEPPPAGVSTYVSTLHGNGFWNSGVLDGDAASPLPSSTQVRFGAPGTFAFICLIHPFMRGEVTVTP